MNNEKNMIDAAKNMGLHTEFEGLVKKEGRLNTQLASNPEDVVGFDYIVQWEGNCYEFYSANPPLIGCTQAKPIPYPLGVAVFNEYNVDYKRAIELFHTGDWGGRFTAIALFKPLHPEIKEPYWYFISDLGVKVVIGANTGDFVNL
ncbi:hypothetical protein [Vibrio sonorensis]|uniref:hypothetical protein n=1 Tax=Vibrio sonorensis TaxID=1004316 RepID=UPI0008DA7B84|nr:hypothetical protein [Vibrio sonorensis]